jgi:hypothetical protein
MVQATDLLQSTFDHPIPLDAVSLVAVDSVYLARTVRALKHCLRHVRFRDAFLFTDRPPELPPEIEPVTIPRLHSIEVYSEFLLRGLPTYREKFADHILIIQHDGFILNPCTWRADFLDYDYIGAPWADGAVGNGGFSLRSRRLLAALAVMGPDINVVHPEDDVLCRRYRDRLEARGIRFAPTDVAAAFSVESRPYAGSFGYHGHQTQQMSGFSIEDTLPLEAACTQAPPEIAHRQEQGQPA